MPEVSGVEASGPGGEAGGPGVEAGGFSLVALRRWRVEILLVLGVSLGQSAVWAALQLLERLTRVRPLGQQTAAVNASQSARPYFDLTYQLTGLFFALVPVMLALFLLSEPGRSACRRIGFDLRRPGWDAATGFGMAALIGIPGLGLYLLGRQLGITVAINPAALADHWWVVPVLILAAAKNAIVEEVLAVGYLLERLRQIGWSWFAASLASASLRGAYHLYQGIGPFFGNVAMGLIFNEFYRRKRRTMPLVVAHFLLDIVAFVGWWLVPAAVRAYFS